MAVDGVDLAANQPSNALAVVLRDLQREVIRESIDDFHHPRAVRYRRGHDSSDGFC